MRIISTLLALFIGLLGAAVGILFYLDNLSLITVNFLGQPLVELQLALWLLLFFAAGTVFGSFLAGLRLLKCKK